jgi:ATP-binding cassette subfamily F protein 3
MAVPESCDQAMESYSQLLEQFELAGGYTYELEIKRVLEGLGFAEADFDKPLGILSGGQRTRAQLARLLLNQPDLLLLDEPVNHLDLQATEWLEEYLAAWPGTLLVVAHDRYFLDRVANRVWEMSFGALEIYSGNYSHYAEVREQRQARRRAEYQEQQQIIAETEEFIRRYKAGQRSAQARGRQKRLERLERLDRPREERTMEFGLKSQARGGNNVLVARGLQVGYGHPLFSGADLLLLRGERVAVLGPNGSGKTTFLRTILGEVPPLSGEVRLGPSIRVAYLVQGHEDLDEDNTILDEILSVKNLPVEQARGLLGRFLFTGDDVFKRIRHLSGGERGRVALAKITLEGANFLLLDEPTNHLDIASQEMLERVLGEFDGTILFVSHDRYFTDALATQVWAVEDGRVRVYEGNYSTYLEQKRAEKVRVLARSVEKQGAGFEREQETAQRQALRLLRQKEERRVSLESEIHRLEARLSALTVELEEASQAQRLDRLYDLGREYADVQEELNHSLEQWAAVGEEG